MTLRSDLEQIRDRALAALKDAHDYYSYTEGAWRTLQLAVRDGLKFTLRNVVTNSTITEGDFVARAQRYVAEDLASASLQKFVSLFENFLFDVLRLWLLTYPAQLSGRQLSGKEILAKPDKDAIVDALVDKELRDIFYDRPANWFDYLRRHAGIDRPTEQDADQFAEVKATRDVLVHGGGVINAYYLDKAGALARGQAGHPLNVPEPYHRDSWTLIDRMVRGIGDALAAKA
jgi:hypothetical protein